MHREQSLSSTHEMYLKVLYRVRGHHEVARVRDLAGGLGVSPGTVTGVLKKLKEQGFVDHERYGVVTLTAAGAAVAECLIRRYETLRAMLIEVLNVEPDTAEQDACMMEHAVSPTTINRMRALLEAAREGRVALPVGVETPESDVCVECEASGTCQAGVGA